jgi:two-component system LytT family sensor kinase
MGALQFVALFVYGFGAFTYGATLVLWATGERRSRVHPVEVMLTAVSAVWFVAHLANLLMAGVLGIGRGLAGEVVLVAALLFPPLIMHTVYLHHAPALLDRPCLPDRGATRPAGAPWSWPLAPMWIACTGIAATAILGIHDVLAVPAWFFARLELTIAGAFSLTGLYGMAVMMAGRRRTESSDQRRARRSFAGLFALIVLLFLPVWLSPIDGPTIAGVIELLLYSLPLTFLVTATWFENRFSFYDVLVKRGLTMLATLVGLVAVLALVVPWLERIETISGRIWTLALVLLPLGLLLPAVARSIGRWLDRAWFGRRHTPLDAIESFLAATHEAASERQLVALVEARLGELFEAPVAIAIDAVATGAPDHAAAPDSAGAGLAAGQATPDAGPVDPLPALGVPIRLGGRPLGRVVFGARAGRRPFLSEDVSLARLLADVLAHLIEAMQLRERRRQQERQSQELTLQASRSELKALRAQINPHFLFNALNAIAGLIPRRPDLADRTIERLAEVFRYTLVRSDEEWVRLDEEMAFVEAYLSVEQARFGDRLSVEVEMDAAAGRAVVPSLVGQVLAENAIKHGVCAILGPATVNVSARLTDGRVRLEVVDNGPGFPAPGTPGPQDPRTSGLQDLKTSPSPRFGLRNVRERLEGYFGDDAALTVCRDEAAGLTGVAVEMPLVLEPPVETSHDSHAARRR